MCRHSRSPHSFLTNFSYIDLAWLWLVLSEEPGEYNSVRSLWALPDPDLKTKLLTTAFNGAAAYNVYIGTQTTCMATGGGGNPRTIILSMG